MTLDRSTVRPNPLWIIGALLIVIALSLFSYYPRFWPVDRLGKLSLGMSEVDATLAYGRKADGSSVSKNGQDKVIIFQSGPYYYEVRLRKAGQTFKIYQICSNSIYVESKGLRINDRFNEQDVLLTLGKPSYISVNQEGTRKISSFGTTKLAFMFDAEMIQEICVSDNLPVKFGSEYGT